MFEDGGAGIQNNIIFLLLFLDKVEERTRRKRGQEAVQGTGTPLCHYQG